MSINPFNAQALRLAEKNKVDLPEAVKASQKQEKKRRRAQKRASGGNSRIRVLLIVMMLLLIVAAAAYVLTEESDEPADVNAEVAEGETTVAGPPKLPTSLRQRQRRQ